MHPALQRLRHDAAEVAELLQPEAFLIGNACTYLVGYTAYYTVYCLPYSDTYILYAAYEMTHTRWSEELRHYLCT